MDTHNELERLATAFDTTVGNAANGSQSSAAQCQHVRAVSPTRVARTLGNVKPLALSQIRETIAVILDVA